MNTTEYIKKLEALVTDGEKLRDSMRRDAESKDAIIRRQAGELRQMVNITEALRERRNIIAQKLQAARGDVCRMKSRLEKCQSREPRREAFWEGVKSSATEMGIWEQLQSSARQKMAESEVSTNK